MEEDEHIHQGDRVVLDAPHDAAILLLVHGIGAVEQTDGLIGHVGHLGELPGGHLVRQAIAVLGLDVGKACGGIHLVIALQAVQQAFLLLIVPPGHQHGGHVLGPEGVVHPLVGDLLLAVAGGLHQGVAIDIGAAVGQDEAGHQHHQEHGHADIAQLDHQAAPLVDLRQKLPVLGSDQGVGKQHQQAGHQGEHRQHAETDGLDEHHSHVRADAELHEQHGPQAGDGGQTAGGNGWDGVAHRVDAGLAGVAGLALLGEPVEQDDGIVDGQCQLQHHRHRIGDEGDGAEPEVCAHIQQGGGGEGEDHHGQLGIGAGGDKQHQHDDDGGDGQDDRHLLGQGVRLGHAHRGGDIGIIVAEEGPDVLHGRLGRVVVLLPVKGDGDQGVGPLHVVGDVLRGVRLGIVVLVRRGGGVVVPQLGRGHAVDALDLPGQVIGDVICHMGHHDPRRAEGGHLVVHQSQALAGLGVF